MGGRYYSKISLKRKTMKKTLKIFLCDADYIFLNYFVASIPCWWIRRLFYVLHGMKLGRRSRINMKCIIYAPWKINIGNNTIINEHSLLDGRGGLSIGDNVAISMYSILYTASHYSWSPEFEYYTKKTEIEDNCWIGTRAIIHAGSTMHKNSILSAGSVLKGEAQKDMIYEGVPAIAKKKRTVNGDFEIKTTMFFH